MKTIDAVDPLVSAEMEDENKSVFQSSPALKNQKLIVSLIIMSLIVFFVMWFSFETESLFFILDEPINEYFLELRESSSEFVINVARIIGKTGSQGITAFTIILLTVFALRRLFRNFWLLFASVVGVEFLWLPVVFGIGRPRPTEVRTVGDVVLPGFPSGHVMIFIAFFGALLYLYYINVKNKGWRIAIAVAVLSLFVLTGFIRLFFNAHYFTDVIAGYALGFAWVPFALTLVDWIFLRRQNKEVS
jgi:undecaprenyl-diphosphatase